MPESSEEQQPSPVEQGNTPPWRQETAQNQSSVDRPITSLDMLEKGDITGYMDNENKKYLRENAETPEIAMQLIEVYENSKKLHETVAKFSKDDPNIPASEETKQKLKLLDVVDYFIGDKDKHEIAGASFLLPLLGGGVVEYLNYLGGGTLPPGLSAEVGLAIGAAMGGSIEGYNLARKGRNGAEKVKALIAKYKPTGAETPQSLTTQKGVDKAA
jgi:hypothetical protein